ncbi:hypothetical protein VE23_25310 [Paenibacillus sp. D9]|uniref:hypothetical protein n=1 Tax=Paenibacillus sp. D9 TaxID=665792 RepID=UPI00061E4488|nr:hypothetical protein [Paenibacillus sp. D9]KKC45840.1 hypothetical protein VE23_25310 [Paenibacillus sp. D9]
MNRMSAVIQAIEDAGIEIVRSSWKEDGHLQVDVDPSENDRAVEAVQAYWRKQKEMHLESIGLLALVAEEAAHE